MNERSVADRLREEYFALLPDVRRVLEELETEVRYALLPLSDHLLKHEKIAVTSRVKECESGLARCEEGKRATYLMLNGRTCTVLRL